MLTKFVYFIQDGIIASVIRVNAMDFLQIPEESIQSDITNGSGLEHRETIVAPDVGNFLYMASLLLPVGRFE